VVGNGRAIASHKCVMVFPCITDVCTATSLSTQESTKGIISPVLCMGRRGRYPNVHEGDWGRVG
jgi:hypothetical protein